MNKTIEIAGHSVEYWYSDNYDHEIEFEDSDFEHIKECLIDGYIEGELCTIDDESYDLTHYGWWIKFINLKGN